MPVVPCYRSEKPGTEARGMLSSSPEAVETSACIETAKTARYRRLLMAADSGPVTERLRFDVNFQRPM